MKTKTIEIIKSFAPYKYVSKLRDKTFETQNSFPTPTIYNSKNEEMKIFYLQDYNMRSQPYSFVAGRFPQNILWDRYNKALDVQFYTHSEILHLSPYIPKKRFAYFIESEALSKESYQLLYNNQSFANEFDTVFTTSDKHLNELSNAKFCPAGGVWYGTEVSGGTICQNGFEKKEKNISIVSSAKTQCPLHNFRIELAKWCVSSNLVDTFGTFNGGKNVKISETLETYRYSIVIENNISDYYFTEKILNCFAAMTIPIYVGARKIGDFFNEDGIVRISPDMTYDKIEKALKLCTKERYEERLNIIKQNYAKVKEFISIEDWMYNQYRYLFK